MLSLKQYIKNPNLFKLAIVKRLWWLPDVIYLKLRFRYEMGAKLNLKSPKTFQEKLQWLKLYDRRAQHTNLVDKHEVKRFVANRIGAEYVIPTLAVWDSIEDMHFDNLPLKFVLKTTHGGGSNGILICKDKNAVNLYAVRKQFKTALKSNIYKAYKEWPYKNVKRRIIAEKLLENNGEEIYDYKFFCFDGEPKFFKIDFNRFIEHKANYYNLKWDLLPFGEEGLMFDATRNFVQPPNFDKMVEIAKKLSSGLKFVRIDLYNVGGSIFFGEITFYPASGFGTFFPKEWNTKIGKLIDLNIAN